MEKEKAKRNLKTVFYTDRFAGKEIFKFDGKNARANMTGDLCESVKKRRNSLAYKDLVLQTGFSIGSLGAPDVLSLDRVDSRKILASVSVKFHELEGGVPAICLTGMMKNCLINMVKTIGE